MSGKCCAIAFAALALVLFILPAQAHAYLDPGTGSYLLQIALAAIVGTLFAIRLFWGRIKSFLRNLFSKQEKEPPDES
jgi:drug/metabolite transporter (DMT)-like permease